MPILKPLLGIFLIETCSRIILTLNKELLRRCLFWHLSPESFWLKRDWESFWHFIRILLNDIYFDTSFGNHFNWIMIWGHFKTFLYGWYIFCNKALARIIEVCWSINEGVKKEGFSICHERKYTFIICLWNIFHIFH